MIQPVPPQLFVACGIPEARCSLEVFIALVNPNSLSQSFRIILIRRSSLYPYMSASPEIYLPGKNGAVGE